MQNYFFIKVNGKYLKLKYAEIFYIEGCRNYIKIVTEQRSYLVLITLKRIEEILPADLFPRIHKSFIVSLDSVLGFDSETVYLMNKELPIGHLYKGVMEKVVKIVTENSCRVVRIPENENSKSHYITAI